MKTNDSDLKIGDLASLFGLTPRTIRYYEELGLLKSNDRSEGLHRRYPGRNIAYLRRILQLKSYGLSLGEVKEFFELAERDPSGSLCKKLLLRKYRERIAEEERLIRESEERIQGLRSMVASLESAPGFFRCPGEDCDACGEEELCGMALSAWEAGMRSEPEETAASEGPQA